MGLKSILGRLTGGHAHDGEQTPPGAERARLGDPATEAPGDVPRDLPDAPLGSGGEDAEDAGPGPG